MANDEWYTPEDIIVRADNTLGGIGFDPCCSPLSPAWDYADFRLTEKEDSLLVDWHEDWGPMFLNPPYSKPAPFVEKAIRYRAPSLVLVNTSTGCKWGQALLTAADSVLFVYPRIRFLKMSEGELTQPNQPRYANMLVLLWSDPETWRRFHVCFGGMGVFR